MVLDHHGVQPNPARDARVQLPREERRELTPPAAEHVAAVHALLPREYELALLTLDATGMRVGELEALTWADVDDRRGRLGAATTKTGAARWVAVPPVLFAAVLRAPASSSFEPARRRAAARARARRGASGRRAGVRRLWLRPLSDRARSVTTARTYTHVLGDELELDCARLVDKTQGHADRRVVAADRPAWDAERVSISRFKSR